MNILKDKKMSFQYSYMTWIEKKWLIAMGVL